MRCSRRRSALKIRSHAARETSLGLATLLGRNALPHIHKTKVALTKRAGGNS